MLAFTSGLSLTVNNFIVKATGTDFGEIMACRVLFQMPVMFGIIVIQGTFILGFVKNEKKGCWLQKLWFSLIDVILGNIMKIFPAAWYHQILVIVVGILGALSMLTTFACVIFMPVSSLIF